MKITTKTGDKGETSLFGGRRVSKASRIIEVIGELDELQAVVGWCGAGAGIEMSRNLRIIEDDLYRIMSIVGFEFKCPKNIKPIGEKDVEFLEKEIGKYEGAVGAAKDLRKFVRPGGSEISARLHIARTVCRRVERGMVGLIKGLRNKSGSVPGNGKLPACGEFVLKYLNRLSDLLFMMAVMADQLLGK